mgnify:CR=1 FL=1
MADLLFEIGTEEIPAGFIVPALSFMQGFVAKAFKDANLRHAEPEVFGTPRRLAVRIKDIPEKLDDIEETKMGPARQAAFDADGRPTKAGLGFAKGCGVDISAIGLVQTEKGEYLCLKRVIPGRPTITMLPGVLSELMTRIPFPKAMRWSNPGVSFARPVHWIVALFGGEVLDVQFGNVTAGNVTYGNRFMSSGPLLIAEPRLYEEVLEKAYVIPSIEKRKAIIWEGLTEKAAANQGVVLDKELLDEVANLLEYPHVIMGSFNESFLSLPKEVLVTVMKHHQRYFPLYADPEGKALKHHFLTVSNIIPKDDAVVSAGNERVLKARLSDGSYFFQEDLKVPLAEYARRLKDVIYHKELGTSLEKVERFTVTALYLADRLAPDKKDKVKQACGLCKGDLNSLMVCEFPELQGIMGREYALRQGIDAEVANAIREHYVPASADDRLPSTVVGDITGMADRIDTICGCFGIGLIPTGTSDPYALRRQTIAIANIILGKGYRISITDLIEHALRALDGKLKRPAAEVKDGVLDFFRTRFASMLQGKGIAGDVIEAVIWSFDDPVDTFTRAQALAAVRSEPWFGSICAASKRVENILKKTEAGSVITEGLLTQEQEIALYRKFQEIEQPFSALAAKGDYTAALKLLAGLKEPIDSFFDKVLVMTEDMQVRANRLALLASLVKLFGKVARFAAIAQT